MATFQLPGGTWVTPPFQSLVGVFHLRATFSLRWSGLASLPLLLRVCSFRSRSECSCLTERNMLTHEHLLNVLGYDSATGEFSWKSGRRKGKRAGSVGSHGYRQIMILSKFYTEHRLAWFYVHGHWPSGCIDHIDRDRQNNRFDNLREATPQQNRRNQIFRGYAQTPCGNFAAKIKVDSRSKSYIFLGTFRTEAEAAAAYAAASVEHFRDFSPYRRGS
jgi:hypothetical protein